MVDIGWGKSKKIRTCRIKDYAGLC